MTDNNDFYTETMAHVYISQGYLEKAADIYRYLLDCEPDRNDLVQKLQDVEEQINTKHRTGKDHLVPLFNEWVDLLLKYNKLKKLKKVSESVLSPSRHFSDK